MQPTHYIRRGHRTFVAILITRLIPAIVILIGLIILMALVSALEAPLEKMYHFSSAQFYHGFAWGITLFFLLFVLIVALLFLVAWIEYISFTYAIDEDAFKTRTGIINIKEMSILYRHIQNVDVDQPLLYRMMYMSRLVVLTAAHQDEDHATGHDETEVVIDMIDTEQAEKLQKELLDRSDVETVREVSTPPRTN